jgi:hypothetical protein
MLILFLVLPVNTLNIGSVLLHRVNSHPGYLAEWKGGWYLAYQSFNIELGKFRWTARFQTKDQRLDFGGFDSLNDAKQSCDYHATHLQALNFFPLVASALGNQGMGLLLAASGTHVGFLTIFRRLLRGDTSK